MLCRDDELGLRALIAIDDTTRGPELGGARFRAYPFDVDGIVECRRLAAAMTLKNAVAEVQAGMPPTVQGAHAKLFASRVARHWTVEAIQVLGGYVQRLAIARALLGDTAREAVCVAERT